jgi:electron transport complex protein RnfD
MSTQRVMQNVLLATIPGIIVLTHFFGFGILVNLIWGGIVAIACESLALALRRRPLGFYLKDCSALVTSTLLCIALPPYAPWWLIAVGVASSLLLAKHLYGGLGYNPFNPAMVGYVILLISFPVQMTAWAPPWRRCRPASCPRPTTVSPWPHRWIC